MLATPSSRSSVPPSAALVLLREPMEVGAEAGALPGQPADHMAANHLQRIRQHPSPRLDGCVEFVLSSLSALGPSGTMEALIPAQLAVLRASGIATKEQLVDLLATAQAQDLLSTLIHGSMTETEARAGVLHTRPAERSLPDFMKQPRARAQPPAGLGPAASSHGLLAGRSQLMHKVVASWRDRAMGVPPGLVRHYLLMRQGERSGRAGLAHLLARVDLGECVERLRVPMQVHASSVLRGADAQIVEVILGLEKVVLAGKRVLGAAFTLGQHEVHAELMAKGGWTSQSLLMAGLTAGSATAVPSFAASIANLPTRRAPQGPEAVMSWNARAAQVRRDAVRLVTLLTMFDLWGSAGSGVEAESKHAEPIERGRWQSASVSSVAAAAVRPNSRPGSLR